MLLSIKAYAQSQFSPIISKMENSIFGLDYSSQNDETRVKRLEEQIYGVSSGKTLSQRVEKLKTDLSADLIGQEIKPKTDTFEDESDSIKEEIPQEDKNVNYPIVNQLETQVFKKENKGTNINTRLSNLEQKVFNKVYSDDLNSRVERLKSAIAPEQHQVAQSEDEYIPDYDDILNQNSPTGEDFLTSPRYNRNNSVRDEYSNSSDITIPLAAMEKSVFQRAYGDDNVSNRLSRLESQVLRSNFGQDDPQTRLDRLTSAQRAQKSARKYDGNKFSQNMSAAMQIGAMLLMVLACVL